jgi:hypothetical protein
MGNSANDGRGHVDRLETHSGFLLLLSTAIDYEALRRVHRFYAESSTSTRSTQWELERRSRQDCARKPASLGDDLRGLGLSLKCGSLAVRVRT